MNINKYAFDNSELSEIELLESIQLAEEFINEATWHNRDKFASHYSDHVLKDGEPFASNNPKFAPMSPDEYKEMAEWLTYAPAHKATYKVVYDKRDGTEKRIMDTRAPIIGFVLKHREGDKDLLQRYIKISDTPQEYLPKGVSGKSYRTVVIYVDDGSTNEIVSCYLSQPGKPLSIFRNQFEDELPENK